MWNISAAIDRKDRPGAANNLLGRSATELAPLSIDQGDRAAQKGKPDLGLVYSDELVGAGVLLGDNIKGKGSLKPALAPSSDLL